MLRPPVLICSMRSQSWRRALRIEATRGFVKEHNDRFMNGGDEEREPLFLTAGELIHSPGALLLETEPRQGVESLARRYLHAVEPGVKLHDLPDAKIGMKPGGL